MAEDSETPAGKFSHAEHVELGRYLARTRDELTSHSVSISNRYGKTKARPITNKMETAIKALDRVRSELDEQVVRDLGEAYPGEMKNVYYPPQTERQA